MKKKGLIISTIVMVLVLAASLTTATYAWFTTSSVTTIEGFNVSVTASNFVNIGVLKDYNNAHRTVTADSFVTGDVTYTNGDDGVLGGSWASETAGLGSTLTNNIMWGTQSKAVGVIGGANATSTDATAYAGFDTKFNDGTYTINAANLAERGGETLETPVAAKANLNGAAAGDYVHLFLGVSPSKNLQSNELIILVDATNTPSATVGILSAIHVAYRITKHNGTTTEWKDEDIFGDNHYNTLTSSLHTNVTTEAQVNAYKNTYGVASVPEKTYAYTIGGLSTGQANIDQVELVIYLAGWDSDCVDDATGASGAIEIFFNAVE